MLTGVGIAVREKKKQKSKLKIIQPEASPPIKPTHLLSPTNNNHRLKEDKKNIY